MEIYLFTFDTNYEEAGIIVTTSKGLEHAKELAIKNGAWHTDEYEVINCTKEDYITAINFNLK